MSTLAQHSQLAQPTTVYTMTWIVHHLQVLLLVINIARCAIIDRNSTLAMDGDISLARNSTSRTELSTTTRVFIPLMLKRKMLLRGSTKEPGIQCQSYDIVHENIEPVKTRPDVFWVPHSLIVQEGIRCGTGKSNEYLLVVNGRHLARRSLAESNGLTLVYKELISNKRAQTAFGALHAITPLHLGFEMTAHRECGGKIVYPKGSIFLFVSSSLSKLNLGFASFRRGQIGMISVLNNQNLCAYQDDFKESSFKPASPSSPPKTALSPAPSNPFNLDAPPISRKNVGGRVSPSPSLKPAVKSPSQSSKPSATSSPTPTKSPMRPSPSSSAVAKKSKKLFDCFPSHALVELARGDLIPVHELRVGDSVRSGPHSFSTVFLFTHKDDDAVSRFIRISTNSVSVIELSAGHYLVVNGVLRAAAEVVIGDTVVLGNGDNAMVRSVETVIRRGLHNPQTMDGNIVVNGVVCSTYTEAIRPRIATALLLPLRSVFSLGLWSEPFGTLFYKSHKTMLWLVPECFSV